ncbi:hypothetical protein EJP02_039 [Escherichia phage EJP2]|nr:hypothetical protein EJP02_039 [Escherichia phage EJP2]
MLDHDFRLHTHIVQGVYHFYCNVHKGDTSHRRHVYISYLNGAFSFISYENYKYGSRTDHPMQDYTVLDEGGRFQAELVLDANSVLTLDEIIFIQNLMKEFSVRAQNSEEFEHDYYFNIGIPS